MALATYERPLVGWLRLTGARAAQGESEPAPPGRKRARILELVGRLSQSGRRRAGRHDRADRALGQSGAQ